MLAAGAFALLAGCTTTASCASWVDYSDLQDAYDDSTLVVVGTSGAVVRTTHLMGVEVPVHTITVEQVLKGDAPDPLEVARIPDACSAEPLPDPLDTDDRVILMLLDVEGVWRLLTPYDGVLEAPAGEPLPFVTD